MPQIDSYNIHWPKPKWGYEWRWSGLQRKMMKWPKIELSREGKRYLWIITYFAVGSLFLGISAYENSWGFAVSTAIMWFFSALFFFGPIIDRYLTKRIRNKPAKTPKPKDPNMAIEYLKAKKHRLCPIVKFEN